MTPNLSLASGIRKWFVLCRLKLCGPLGVQHTKVNMEAWPRNHLLWQPRATYYLHVMRMGGSSRPLEIYFLCKFKTPVTSHTAVTTVLTVGHNYLLTVIFAKHLRCIKSFHIHFISFHICNLLSVQNRWRISWLCVPHTDRELHFLYVLTTTGEC